MLRLSILALLFIQTQVWAEKPNSGFDAALSYSYLAGSEYALQISFSSSHPENLLRLSLSFPEFPLIDAIDMHWQGTLPAGDYPQVWETVITSPGVNSVVILSVENLVPSGEVLRLVRGVELSDRTDESRRAAIRSSPSRFHIIRLERP